MLAVRCSSSSFSTSLRSRRWSSILRSSFTCTFLLPSFFPSSDTARRRNDDRGRRFFTAVDRHRRHAKFFATVTRNSLMPTVNGGEQHKVNLNLSSPLIHHSCFSTSLSSSRKYQHKPDWLTDLKFAIPERPPEKDLPPQPLSPPDPQQEEPRDPRFRRFHPHGDLLPDDKFPSLFGFAVPPKPPLKLPRYEKAWIDSLLRGPFLPPQLRETTGDVSSEPADAEKLLLFLERAWGHKHDVITDLAAEGKWQHTVWVVRHLLEPRFEYPADVEIQSVMEGVKYTAFKDSTSTTKTEGKDGGIPSPAIAGRSGLWTIKDNHVKWDIERRRRGFGIVLGSLAGMVLRAGESMSSPDGGKQSRLGDRHTDLLPTVRQILAYFHTSSLIPEALYAVNRYPRLHMLRSRILASLADAIWRAQEAMVAEEAERLGIMGEHRGMEVPRARYRLEVWGSGTNDISSRPTTATLEAAGNNPEQIRKIEWGTYAEREVWLELILTIIVETGFGNIGVDVVKAINASNSKNNRWVFTDYTVAHPSEYTRLAVEKSFHEPKTGVAERWALEGHSLVPPPITTDPCTLPDWILPAVVDAVVDSTAEGRGLESMFATILSYARALPMRKETILRLTRHPALIWSKNPELMEVGAGLLWEFGNKIKAIDMYNTALTLHMEKDNIPGALRVWNEVLKTQHHLKIPNPILGKYLSFLVRNRRLNKAWNLLRFNPSGEPGNIAPVIPKDTYISPLIAPALLALAIASESRGLYKSVVEEFTTALRNYSDRVHITRGTYTSLLNAHLFFSNFEAAKQTLLTMSTAGIYADDVIVGVLVERELKRDLESGYRLVEGAVDPESSSNLKISRDAWNSILAASVGRGDKKRTKWVLDNLGIDLETGSGLDTIVFNTLLTGTAHREGAMKAMELCHRHHTRGEKREDGAVVGDAKSFRVVLHQAIRESMNLEDKWKVIWEGKKKELKGKAYKWKQGVEGKRVMKEMKEEMKKLEAVVEWCWNEVRRSGVEVKDTESIVRVWLRREALREW